MFEKARIKSCLDYFQTDQDDFMQTVENYHSPSTPPSSPPSSPSPRDRSPMPLPVLPRPSFLQSMATSLLSSIPADNTWSWCDCSYRTYTLHYSSASNGRANECNNDPPLLESFALFGGHRTPSPLHLIPDPLLIHHIHQENPRTLTTQPTDTNVMTASMGVVADGKYTAVLYSCYFTKS